jgi:hypothetical protein
MTDTKLKNISTMNGYVLANLADSGMPENGVENLSAGADMLDTVRTSFIEYVEYAGDDYTTGQARDDSMEYADECVPIYTSQIWATFSDLDAWTEDVTEYGELTDMMKGAQVALLMICERLWNALVTEYETEL